MKNLITILFVLFTFFGYSQSSGCEYEMYSDVWDIDCDTGMWKPKGGEKFKGFSDNSVKNEISEEKIREYLLESCNEFRRDYGLMYDVTEDKELTIDAEKQAEKLGYHKIFHSNLKSIKANGEVCGAIPLFTLAEYKPSMGDINKVIAQSTFDIFFNSPSHMKILLEDNKNISFGFGLKYEGSTFYMCYQTYTK